MFITQWQDITVEATRLVSVLTKATFDTEAAAQAKADQLIDTGTRWVVVYEGPAS